jgi:uncharacterized membrane protein (DUF4010 family)
MLAGASGVAEVDAITLSLARMSRGDLAPGVAVTGLVTAAAANSLLKGAMAAGIGGRQLGLRPTGRRTAPRGPPPAACCRYGV